jgi:rod shape-determining protein MreC
MVSVALMMVDHRQGHLETVRSVLSTVVYPLQYIVNLPLQTSRWVSNTIVTQKMLVEENDQLRDEQLLLNAKLQKYNVLLEENNRLRELLESSVKLGERVERVLIAELIAVEMESFRRQIIINKGQRDNVYDGQPVVDANGIMGQVVHVNPFSSTVLLITDQTHSMPVQINRNGLRAIAVGTGQDNVLLLENLPTNADIQTEDLVISSGLGRRFPRGYPVGIISNIMLEAGESFAQVQVTPSANPGRSREVLLVWPYEDKPELSEPPPDTVKAQ